MQTFSKKIVAYRPLELYDENYDKLIALVPDIDQLGDGLVFRNPRDLELQIRVIDSAKYTTTIALILRLKINSRWVTDPSMTLRIYHDARAAEVVSYQSRSPHAPLYPYPNAAMYSRFEKRRLNEFLSMLLDFCLRRTDRFLRIYDTTS